MIVLLFLLRSRISSLPIWQTFKWLCHFVLFLFSGVSVSSDMSMIAHAVGDHDHNRRL